MPFKKKNTLEEQMRLQNTTSCIGRYYAISEQNIFIDLLSFPALCVCVSVCLLLSQIDPQNV